MYLITHFSDTDNIVKSFAHMHYAIGYSQQLSVINVQQMLIAHECHTHTPHILSLSLTHSLSLSHTQMITIITIKVNTLTNLPISV